MFKPISRKTRKTLLAGAFALALGAVFMGAAPTTAHADGFSISYSSGDWKGHHRGGHYRNDRHGHYDRHYRGPSRVVWYGHPGYRRPPVREVVYQNVYVQPAPIVQAAPIAVNPVSPIYASNNGTCREYQTTIKVGNRTQPAYGTACLQPDGSWQTVD